MVCVLLLLALRLRIHVYMEFRNEVCGVTQLGLEVICCAQAGRR